jgi:hypothetical protein
MADETSTNQQDEYTITFKNGALVKIKQLAHKFNIPEDNLDDVIQKGLKALELSDDDKLEFNKGGTKYFIDIKNL